MPQAIQSKILRIHLSEGDKYSGKPLYDVIVSKCRDLKIAGATVFRGLEGYGETAEIHRHHVVAQDQPIIIVVVDTAENVTRLKAVVEEMMDTGMLAVSDVEMKRVQKGEQGKSV